MICNDEVFSSWKQPDFIDSLYILNLPSISASTGRQRVHPICQFVNCMYAAIIRTIKASGCLGFTRHSDAAVCEKSGAFPGIFRQQVGVTETFVSFLSWTGFWIGYALYFFLKACTS